MNAADQRIAIGIACGWKPKQHGPTTLSGGWVQSMDKRAPGKHRSRVRLPDYLNDLNAMHGAEKVLRSPDLGRYLHFVGEVSKGHAIRATAAQRARAFLLAIGKWEDGK